MVQHRFREMEDENKNGLMLDLHSLTGEMWVSFKIDDVMQDEKQKITSYRQYTKI